MTMKPTGYNSRRGTALVLVLWLMTILSALALEVALLSRLRLQATRNVGDSVRSQFLARGGVERAIAELKEAADGPQASEDLREDVERIYDNVELGEGSYTLLAEPGDGSGAEPEYGISDEAARVNLNTADAKMLSRVPGIDPDLAADILLLRNDNKAIHDVGDLLLIQRIDPLVLYGEDQNQNGLLDPNEDDGDESWPTDNRDGVLERGLAAYLTCYSAARNVTSDGKDRVNIAQASAQEIVKGVTDISQQQAESIVEHRKKQEFQSVVDLLDVLLVEKAAEKKPEEKTEGDGKAEESGSQPANERSRPERARPARAGSAEQETPEKPSEEETKSETRTTGKKAFDVEKFKAIADYVTVSEEEVHKGVINVNTASEEVLACLPGVDEALAAEICAHRTGSKFKGTAELLDVRGMSVNKFKQICNLVSVRSDVFSVRSFGVLQTGDASGGIYCCVAAVIDRTGDKIKVRSWRELR